MAAFVGLHQVEGGVVLGRWQGWGRRSRARGAVVVVSDAEYGRIDRLNE
jgi:hypothetical protein